MRCRAARRHHRHARRRRRAASLLDELAAHATQSKYQLRFVYGVGDVVVWDNAALLHSATLIDPNDARTLWRITVLESSDAAAAPDVLSRTGMGM
jgi:taurine dioxygenase